MSPTAETQPLHVCVICSGNICRSPMAEKLLAAAVAEAGLTGRVVVTSAGTGNWHIGSPMNERARRVLARYGYPTDHHARQISPDELAAVDLALAADRGHLLALESMTSEPGKVHLLRSFDPTADDDEVPDPYYGPDEGFDEVYAMTLACLPGVLDEIRRRLR